MSTQFVSRFKDTAQSLGATCRPWREFFDPSALSIPSSISDATTRVTQNLTHFCINYSAILFLVLLSTLITRPIAVIAFLVVLLAWFFLYFARGADEPIVIFGIALDDGVVLVLLVGLTIAALASLGVLVKALASVGIGVIFVIFHAMLRGTDDLVMDDLESPYGPMLSGQDNSRGDYSDI